MRTGQGFGMRRRAAPRESVRRRPLWEAALLAAMIAGVLAFQHAAAAQTARRNPKPVAAPSAHDLAVGESLLHYCAHVDPKAALRVRIRLDAMERGTSRGRLEQLRNTPEYRKAYEAVTKFTEKVDPHNARRMCGEGLQQPAMPGKAPEKQHAGG